MSIVKVALPEPLRRQLETRARSHRVSVSKVIQAFVRDGFDESGEICIACEKKIGKNR